MQMDFKYVIYERKLDNLIAVYYVIELRDIDITKITTCKNIVIL